MRKGKFFRTALTCIAAIAATAACQKAEDVFEIDIESISVDCAEQSETHSILCSGAWTITTAEDWLSFDPSQGTGDGVKQQAYKVNIAYNSGEKRTGTYTIKYNNIEKTVNVSQSKCSFAYGRIAFNGTLTQNENSLAYVSIAYSGASGKESAKISGSVSGPGAEGLSIETKVYSGFNAGSGNLEIPILGTPATAGDITIAINLDGDPYSIDATVGKAGHQGTPTSELTIAFWKFSPDGSSSPTKNELAEEYPNFTKDLFITDGNGATLELVAAEGKTTEPFNFNNGNGCNDGHLYFRGMYVNDAVVISKKNVNVKAGVELVFKGSMGGSGSSAGYFIAEYSTDGNSWTAFPAAKKETIFDTLVTYHVHPMDSMLATDGAFEVSTDLTADAVDIYVRLRVSANVRLTANNTITTGGGGSTRFKGDLSVKALTWPE